MNRCEVCKSEAEVEQSFASYSGVGLIVVDACGMCINQYGFDTLHYPWGGGDHQPEVTNVMGVKPDETLLLVAFAVDLGARNVRLSSSN